MATCVRGMRMSFEATVWAWLIGPYVDAWLKLNPGKEQRGTEFFSRLSGPSEHEACIG